MVLTGKGQGALRQEAVCGSGGASGDASQLYLAELGCAWMQRFPGLRGKV